MENKRYISILIFLIFLKFCENKSFYNHTLYRGLPTNERHLDFFKSLSEKYEVNFWREPGQVNMPVEFVITPESRLAFLKESEQYGLYLTTVIEDVQKAFDEQTVKTYVRRKMDTFDWRNFYRLDSIYKWLYDLATIFPNQMKVTSIGKTYEGRDIVAVIIRPKGRTVRSKVFIEGGIHAREWMSPSFVTYLIYNILHSEVLNKTALEIVAKTYEWYIVPVLNPDGYEHTFGKDRMWRKNRHKFGKDYGVDLNRNFDSAFGTSGVSNDKQKEIFCGEGAHSENETAAMADFVERNSARLEYYLAFHSYGQYMILPYAHSKGHEDNYNEVLNMCKEAASNMAAKYGTKYTYGTAYETVGYVTSGVSGCWVKKTFKVPYVITFELRDNGRYGFALPPKQIMPTCVETLEGVISLLMPRTKSYHRLGPPEMVNKQTTNVLDRVFVCCMWLFILY